MSKTSKHEFAFYLENNIDTIGTFDKENEIRIESAEIAHRLSHIVRAEKKDIFILFNRTNNTKLELIEIEKKKVIVAKIIKIEKNISLKPNINFILPLLKRDYFETSLYSLAELGANTITTIFTKKSQQKWQSQKANKRFLHIITSAAEQSKNFSFPELKTPTNLQDHINEINNKENSISIFFDPEGENLDTIIQKINIKSFENINLMIGPEGDLAKEEKNMIKNKGFIFCKLTPTVLRSCQAVAVGLGAFRSLLK